MIWVWLLVLAAVVGGAALLLLRRRRSPVAVDPRWYLVLERRWPLFRRLPTPERERLVALIARMLSEKRFEGCGGQRLTPDMPLLIAAQAAVLWLGFDDRPFPRVRTVLVYPSTFVPRRLESPGSPDPEVVVAEGEPTLGESWSGGAIVLAWDSVKEGMADAADGYNVVMHEFSHQVDDELGVSAVLGGRDPGVLAPLRGVWENLQSFDGDETEAPFDLYGAEDPAEFFAVLTEEFFERPARLLDMEPEVYRVMRDLYRTDPALWGEGVTDA